VRWFAEGNSVDLADDTPDAAHRIALERVDGLLELVRTVAGARSPDDETVLMELALEGLHHHSVIAREDLDGGVSYRDMLKEMLAGLEE
jgi:magnesium chelatase subunit I